MAYFAGNIMMGDAKKRRSAMKMGQREGGPGRFFDRFSELCLLIMMHRSGISAALLSLAVVIAPPMVPKPFAALTSAIQ